MGEHGGWHRRTTNLGSSTDKKSRPFADFLLSLLSASARFLCTHDQFPLLRTTHDTHTTTTLPPQTSSGPLGIGPTVSEASHHSCLRLATILKQACQYQEQGTLSVLYTSPIISEHLLNVTHSTMASPTDSNNGDQGYRAQFTMMDKVKEYLEALNVAVSEKLHIHAAEVLHEDLPHNAESSAASTTETGTVTPSSVRSVVPDRLNMRIPPLNYGAVVPGSIYRSSYPEPANYEFLKDLKIKSILTLVPEPIAPEYQSFMDEAGIQHFRVHIRANKGEVRVDSCEMQRALRLVMDRSNQPILIHCNKGKHRTGCTVACFRRICGLDMETIREEYHTYAGKKARFLDEVFFENFDLNLVMWMARQENWAGNKIECGPGLGCDHVHEEEVEAVDIAAPPSPPATPIMCLAAPKPLA